MSEKQTTAPDVIEINAGRKVTINLNATPSARRCCNTCARLSLDEGRRCYECASGHYSTIVDPETMGADCYDWQDVAPYELREVR